MRKVRFLLFCMLIVAMTTLFFFACTGKDDPAEETVASVKISVNADGISFTHSDYEYFFYVLDDEEAEEIPAEVALEYATTVGEHHVKVYARDAAGNEVGAVNFTYTTAKVALSDLSVAGKTVSWVATALKVSVKEGGEYAPANGSSYTAEKEDVTVTVKAEGGFDAQKKIFYTGSAITKSAKIVSTDLKVLRTPDLSVDISEKDLVEGQTIATYDMLVKRVVWTRVAHASGYAVSYDGGDFRTVDADSLYATISDAVGTHSIRVKALGDAATYADSVPALYSYETRRAARPTLKKTAADAATVTSDATCYFSVDDKEFLSLQDAAYKAGESCLNYFRAWGFNRQKAINYVVSEPVTMSFIAPAARPLVVEDGTPAESGGSRWMVEKQSEGAWAASDTSVTFTEKYDGSSALKLNARADGASYRFTAPLALSDGYDTLSFYYHGDGASTVTLTLYSEQGEYFVARDLGVLPAYWQLVTLRLDDATWKLNGADGLASLWANRTAGANALLPEEIRTAFSLYEVWTDLDSLSFTILAEGGKGGTTAHYLDDLQFAYSPDLAESVHQPLFAIGTSYVAYEQLDSGKNELLLFLGEEGVKIYSTVLEENFILNGTYEISEETATLTVSGADFSFTAAFAGNGREITVKSASGAQAEHFLACESFLMTADLTVDFESGISEEAYEGEDWSAYYQASDEWRSFESATMIYDERDGSTVLRFEIGKDLTDKYVYNEAGKSLGLVNTFSIALGNCMEGAAALDLKLILVDVNGERYYLKGSAGGFDSYAVTDGLASVKTTLPFAISLSSVEIIVRNRTENSVVYLYVDDLTASYQADPSVFSGYPEPTVVAGDGAFTFLYDEEAAFEYSLNDGDWVEGASCPVPASSGYYRLRVRALLGSQGDYTKVATYTFSVEEVYLSAISVSIEEDGQTASWTTNGVTSIRVDVKTDDGSLVGEYQPTERSSYFTDKDVTLFVRSEGYFDQENKKYYVGTQEISKKILVEGVLPSPVVQAGQAGLTWAAVEDANAYAVSVNGGDYVTREDLTYPFATNEGEYVVRVMSVLIDDAGEILAYSEYDEYLYTVRNVTLPSLTVVKDTVSWNAVAYKLYLKVDVADYEERQVADSYTATAVGENMIAVKAVGGYDEENRVYYYAAKDVVKNTTISVWTLSAPTLLVKEDKSGLYWAFVNEASEQITTIEDFASLYPEVTYQISVNGGEWRNPSENSYPFPTTAGEYTVEVKAIGNGANIRSSEPSAAYAFEVKEVSLSADPIYLSKEEREQGGSTILYDFTALKAYRKIGDKGAETETVEHAFTTEITTSYTMRVVGGFDEENKVFYAGEEQSATWTVIVPIKLAAPVLNHTESGISWSAVLNANAYSVSVNGGAPEILQGTSLEYNADFGSYTIEVRALNTLYAEQYPVSDAASLTYRVVQVALSDLSIDGAVVSWTYEGYLSMKLGEAGVWNPYSGTTYANESGDDATVYLKAEAWYDHENIVIYKGKTVEKYLDVVYSELLTPNLVLNEAENGLLWSAVSKATGYAYKSLSFDLTEVEIQEEKDSSIGWTATEGLAYPFLEDDADHLLLIKAVGNGSTISDSVPVEWRYSSRTVALASFSVTKGVASWTKQGFTEYRVYGNNGVPGEWKTIEETELNPEATITIDLRSKKGYDKANNLFYHGETVTLTEEQIIVPIGLKLPVVTMRSNGILVEIAAPATTFKYVLNDGGDTTPDSNLIPYSDEVGTYTLKIRACNPAEAEQYPDSGDVQVTYDVRTVSLSSITSKNVTEQGGFASFTADGLLKVSLDGENFTDYEPAYDHATYQVDYLLRATATVTVKAERGVRILEESSSAVKYIGASDLSDTGTVIVPITLATPTLSENSDKLVISAVAHADQYLVSVDDGAWTPQSANSVSYSTVGGTHSIKVKAHSTAGDGQYPDSAVATLNYTTASLSLSDISVSGATFSWSAQAHSVKIKVTSGDYNETSSSSYTASASGTTKLYVRAYRGYLASAHTYYYASSSYLEKSATVTISKLSTPSLTVSGKNLTWSAVSGAKQYGVKVGSAAYSYQSGTSYTLSSQEGTYTVKVKAVNNDDSTVLDSAEVTFTYTTKTVSLSNITVSGSKASWTAVANKTYLKVGSGSYSETTATSYTPSGEGTFVIKVKAEGGWNASSNTYYYAASAIEKSASVTLATLATPSLTTTSKAVTWSAVANASTYAVSVDGAAFKNQSDKSVSFSTVSGSHTVKVKAIATANSGYSDSSVATFTYETKQTSLTFLTQSATMVTWKCVGLKAQYSTNNGSSYTDTTNSGYTATASGSVKFRAVGGWNAAASVYYNGTTDAVSKTFTLPGLCIANNFEKGASGWTKDYFNGNTNKWDSTTLTSVTSVADAYGAGSAIKLQSYLNGNAFRFGYQFGDLPGDYKSMSFDIKLNEYASDGTSFRFQDSASGTYVDYNMKHLNLTPGVWYHVSVGFEDSNLIINSGNKEYKPSDAIKYLGKSGFYSKIKALDVMYVTVKGNTGSGPQVFTYLDNVQFSTATVSSATKTPIKSTELTFNDGSVGDKYTNSKWKQYKWESNGYSPISGYLSIASPEKALNLYCGGNTYKITYNEGGSSLGSVNHFSIDLGGDKNTTVKYRIELITKNGSSIYAAGSETTMATLSSANGVGVMETLNFNFDTTEIKTIVIYATTGDGHLFMDNVTLSKLS